MESRISQRWGAFRGVPLSTPALSQGAAVRRLQRFARARVLPATGGAGGGARVAKKCRPPAFTQMMSPYTRKMNTFIPRIHRRVVMIPEATDFNGEGETVQGRSTFNLNGIRPDATIYTNMSSTGTAAIPDLESLQQLFRYYRIVKIRVFFRIVYSEFTDNVQYPTLYTRYCYDANTGLPMDANYFSELTNTNRHTFTNESPEFVTTIYPKIQSPKFALTGLSSDGFAYAPTNPGWIDLSGAPAGSAITGCQAQHYGLDWFCTNVPTGQVLRASVEFTIDYKTQV